MGQAITPTKNTPGAGTRVARRREQEQESVGAGLGDAWRLVVFLFAMALAIALGWLLGSGSPDVVDVTPNGAEAATIADEKVALLAAGPEVVSAAQEAAAHQGEKGQLLAGSATAALSDGDALLRDEKAVITDRSSGPAEPDGPSDLTEQGEKELLLAG